MDLEDHEFYFEADVAADPSTVFDFICDLSNASTLTPSVKKIKPLNDLPFGPGFRWKETRRMFLIISASAEIEVTALEADGEEKSYSVLIDDNCNWCAASFTVSPAEGGSRVVYRGEAKQYKKNRKTKQKELVPSPFMARMIQKHDKCTLENLVKVFQ